MFSHSEAEQPEIPFLIDTFENENCKNKTRRNSTGGKESAMPWKQHSQNILIQFPANVMQMYKQGSQPTA